MERVKPKQKIGGRARAKPAHLATGSLMLLLLINLPLLLLLLEAPLELAQAKLVGYRPSLTKLLESVGIDERTEPLADEEVALVRRIRNIYEQDELLSEQERALLASLGVGSVDPKSKVELKVMFNHRLRNALRIELLSEQFRRLTANSSQLEEGELMPGQTQADE